MPPTFLLFVGFAAAILLAPVVLAVALACLAMGRPQLGRQLLTWGARGAVGFALGGVGLGLVFGDHPAIGGLSGGVAGAAAGFTLVSLSAVALGWWRARRVR